MTAKQYLRLIRSEQKELKILKEKKETIYYSLLPSAIRYDKDNIQTSPEDMLSEKVVKMADLTREIDEHIKYLENHKADAMHMIRQIKTPICRQVLILYYLTVKENNELTSWADVSEIICLGDRQTQRIHKEALKEFQALF